MPGVFSGPQSSPPSTVFPVTSGLLERIYKRFSLYIFPELLSGNLFSIFFFSQFLVRRISLHMFHPGFFVRMVPLARGGHLEVRRAHALERPRAAGSVSGPK